MHPVMFGTSLFGQNNLSDAGCVRSHGPDVSGQRRAALGALWTMTGLAAWVRPYTIIILFIIWKTSVEFTGR
jgi:hypothetical protein